jgi:hypothetical protein
VDLGGGNFVVYSGTGNSATVGNLNGNTNYQFRLYEYKKNVNTGNYALYQLANAASGSQNTLEQQLKQHALILTETAKQTFRCFDHRMELGI